MTRAPQSPGLVGSKGSWVEEVSTTDQRPRVRKGTGLEFQMRRLRSGADAAGGGAGEGCRLSSLCSLIGFHPGSKEQKPLRGHGGADPQPDLLAKDLPGGLSLLGSVIWAAAP